MRGFRRQIRCYQRRVFGRLAMTFIMRRVVTQVRGRLFVDAAGGAFYNFCSILTLYCPSYYKSTYLLVGILSFSFPMLLWIGSLFFLHIY